MKLQWQAPGILWAVVLAVMLLGDGARDAYRWLARNMSTPYAATGCLSKRKWFQQYYPISAMLADESQGSLS